MAPKTRFYSLSNALDTLFDTVSGSSYSTHSPAWDDLVYREPMRTTTAAPTPWSVWNLDDLIGTHDSDADLFGTIKSAYQGMPSFPACDVSIDKESGDLFLEAALPGYNEEDIEVTFENDQLKLQIGRENALSEKKDKNKENRVYIRNSLKTSKVSLSVPVPASRFVVKDAEANYHNGILSIRVPRQEAHQPHRITLKSGNRKEIGE